MASGLASPTRWIVTVAGIGLVAFIVTQRTKEIAIRLALGAQPGAVLTAVLRQFLWPTVAGLAVGAGFAAFGSKFLRVVLYGVNNLDPASYVTAIAVLSLIVAASMLVPAARTLRMNLGTILHHD